MSLNLLVRSTGKKYSLEKGGKYKFNAVSKETYELIATDGKVLLNETSAQRKGNDLVLASKDEDIEVTIEGFWKECKAPEDNADADNSDDRCFAVLNTLDANAQPGVVTITQNGPILSDLTAGQVGTLEDCNNGIGAIFWLGAAGLLAGAVALGAGGSGGGGGRGDTDDDGSVHIDSNDDGDIDNSSPSSVADKPSITPNEADGSVTVTPGANNVKVDVTFKDEDGNDKTVVAEKGEDGKWKLTDPNNTGATIDPETGVITIPQDSVKDGEPVNATGTDDKGATAPADPVNAGTDGKDAAVDANGGVVTSQSSVDEGGQLVTTVKLTNNNGVDNLTIATAGSATPEDFGAPTYSNGVTANDDGTLNVPAGVTEFTITVPVKADESTEGNETVQYTVGGVAGNEITINDTSLINATDKPIITPNETDGSVTVTPGANNVKVEVNFPGEDDEPNKVTGTKGDDGKWTLDDPNNTGATIDPDTGVITIPQDSVKDGEPINATGTDDKGVTAPADPVNAGSDSKDAAVDANGGVVTSPSSVDEGAELVTTVKLTNNNGADNLTIATAGSASAEDFGTPVYSNGVTANEDGTLNVPAGVTEFTITTPVKEDETTEGNETVKYTVGGVNGNEVTINDTSVTSSAAKVDNSNNNGVVTSPTPVNEGANLVTTVKLTNGNGVEGLVVNRQGTGAKPTSDADFDDTTTIYKAYDANGNEVANGVTVVGGKLNVAAGVREFEIVTKVKEDDTTEGNETVKYTVGGVDGNEVTINDTSLTPTPVPTHTLGWLPLVLRNYGNNVIEGVGAPNSTFTLGDRVVRVGANGHWQTDESFTQISQSDNRGGVNATDTGLLIETPDAQRAMFYMFDKIDEGHSNLRGTFDFRDRPDHAEYQSDVTLFGRLWGHHLTFENFNKGVVLFSDGNISGYGPGTKKAGFAVTFTEFDDILNLHNTPDSEGIGRQDNNTAIDMGAGNDIYIADNLTFKNAMAIDTDRVGTFIDMGTGNDFLGVRGDIENLQHAMIMGGEGFDTFVLGYEGQQSIQHGYSRHLNLNIDRISGFEHVIINKYVWNLDYPDGKIRIKIKTDDVLENNTRYIDADQNVIVEAEGFSLVQSGVKFEHNDFYGNKYVVTYNKYVSGDNILYIDQHVSDVII